MSSLDKYKYKSVHWPAFQGHRLQCLRRHYFYNIECLYDVPLINLLIFAKVRADFTKKKLELYLYKLITIGLALMALSVDSLLT